MKWEYEYLIVATIGAVLGFVLSAMIFTAGFFYGHWFG